MPALVDRLVVVGVGLIGGSIALAARLGVAKDVIGVVRSEASRRRAIDSGAVEAATLDLGEAVASADLVVVCTPVADIATTIADAARACPQSALLTDAGSTKQAIVESVEAQLAGLKRSPAFVGSHPLAGDHRAGPESARAELLEGRTVVVTPSDATPSEITERAAAFWQALGAEVTLMSPAAHDAALARTSHLPHLLAAALAGATPADVLPLAAGGWRDTTRVAAGSPALWRDILLANRRHVLQSLADATDQLAAFREALATGDAAAIEQLLEQGRERRDAVGD